MINSISLTLWSKDAVSIKFEAGDTSQNRYSSG